MNKEQLYKKSRNELTEIGCHAGDILDILGPIQNEGCLSKNSLRDLARVKVRIEERHKRELDNFNRFYTEYYKILEYLLNQENVL